MADESFDSQEVITNNNDRRRDMPLDESGVPVTRVGKARGLEHDLFESVGGTGRSGRQELVKCTFCGLVRTRISLRMRDHLAKKCPGSVPADLRQQFLKTLPAFNRSQDGTASNGVRKRGGNNSNNSKVSSNGHTSCKDERMMREEHELKMKKMKAEFELAEEQKRVVGVVGSEIVRVLQNFDSWLRTGSASAARVAFVTNAFPQPANSHY